MWGSRGWRWIFGLALVLPALVMLPTLGRDAEAGATGVLLWATLFAVVWLACVVFITVAALAGTVFFAIVVEDIIPGLRGD